MQRVFMLRSQRDGEVRHTHPIVGPGVVRVGLQHPVEPGEQLFGAVIRVEDDRHLVQRRDGAGVERERDGAGNRRLIARGGEGFMSLRWLRTASTRGRHLVVCVLDALATVEGAAALRDLNDDRVLRHLRRLEAG